MRFEGRCSISLKFLLAIQLFKVFTASAFLTNQPTPAGELEVPTNTKRFALVVAPAGPASRHKEWLHSARHAGRNWDLALIYYGPEGDKFKCSECVSVTFAKCAKWRCLSGLLNSTEWNDNLRHRYESVMVADDDLGLKAVSLNLFFKTFRDYRLKLAQPSLCPGSFSAWLQVVGQRTSSMMRFTNFVELMAPTFTTDFLSTGIRSTIGEAYTGWGLDFVWPFLLKFPRDKVAIVDGVCIQHARPEERHGGQRIYDLDMPRNADEEKNYMLDKFNYNEKTLAEFNMTNWKPVTFGMLPFGSRPLNPPPDLEPEESTVLDTQKLMDGLRIQMRGVGIIQQDSSEFFKLEIVGIVFAVLFLVASIFWVCRRRRGSKRGDHTS